MCTCQVRHSSDTKQYNDYTWLKLLFFWSRCTSAHTHKKKILAPNQIYLHQQNYRVSQKKKVKIVKLYTFCSGKLALIFSNNFTKTNTLYM